MEQHEAFPQIHTVKGRHRHWHVVARAESTSQREQYSECKHVDARMLHAGAARARTFIMMSINLPWATNLHARRTQTHITCLPLHHPPPPAHSIAQHRASCAPHSKRSRERAKSSSAAKQQRPHKVSPSFVYIIYRVCTKYSLHHATLRHHAAPPPPPYSREKISACSAVSSSPRCTST